MSDSKFLVQIERYTFFELTQNSSMPASSRVAVPITDPEFNVSYYLTCKKEHSKKFGSLF